MTEKWHDVVGYEGDYQVSNCGRVRSFHINKRGKIKIEATHYKGHKKVWLCHQGTCKRYFVHWLVAIAFIPQMNEDRIIVNHKDGNKKNNHVENLEWVTMTENTQHYFRELRIPLSELEDKEF